MPWIITRKQQKIRDAIQKQIPDYEYLEQGI